MKKNMGSIDRVLRIVLAIAFVLVAVNYGGLFWILGALGVVFVLTAAVGVCPLYMPFKISTRKGGSN